MLINKIKDDSLVARKSDDRVVSDLLVTLFSEASMIGKNDGSRESTDEEVIAIIKKFIKNIDEVLIYADSKQTYKLEKEKGILQNYLPEQFTKDILKKYIHVIIYNNGIEISPKSMGTVMMLLKKNYAGLYDGKMASEIVKEILNG